ncbi:hypothetical protein AD948_00400 [Acetobacter senegalensis]|uniref:Uncharacterized protein n=1 Tax=Acetobacter senegalensis TaxID=446692 RepID=A0A149U8M6_9PROT|nr:hypothetical protein [Acetobacter senegalensis]KXV61813.1 hypothetical protein AD948_00400 [Acetobacter senegalensis]
MEDAEIYELAGEVLSRITNNINDTVYAPLGGKLSISWSEKEIYGAYASSLSQSDKPPQHSITIYYEFVRQVWRDIENFCEFLRSRPEGDFTPYEFYDNPSKLPRCFNEDEHVRNMFVAAITWVYFHELGHLMQEHGIIRHEWGPRGDEAMQTTDVHDFEVSHHKPIHGREALVSHVTELAADFAATHFYAMELLRHIEEPSFADDQERPEVFSGTLYLMVCGLSLVFFRFNGSKPIVPIAAVEGSHPKPLTRLELLLPHLYEYLGVMKTEAGHGLNQEQLEVLCAKAVFSTTMYWSMTNTEDHKFDDRFMLQGVQSSPAIMQYLQPVVAIWDEMLPRIKEVRRFDSPLILMHFTDAFREKLNSVSTQGSGPEANATAVTPSSPDEFRMSSE